jgi:hypothetical protein
VSEEINPWKALRFACDGLERICMGTADEADSSSIAERALFAAIGHMGVADLPAAEDAPGSGSQPETVIVVTEAGPHGKPGRELRYDANQADTSEYGILRILRKGHPVGEHQSPGWLSWREDGALVPDATVRALGIAKRALSEIVKRADDGGEQPFGRPEIGGIASTALNDIWTETEG